MIFFATHNNSHFLGSYILRKDPISGVPMNILLDDDIPVLEAKLADSLRSGDFSAVVSFCEALELLVSSLRFLIWANC